RIKYTFLQTVGGHQNTHKKERMKKKRLQLQARKTTINYYLQQPNFPNNNYHSFSYHNHNHNNSNKPWFYDPSSYNYYSNLTSQFVKNPKLASTPMIKIQIFWSKKHQIVI
ncbi:hypothetical protein HN51_034871, partial [Arachis hypogaea]